MIKAHDAIRTARVLIGTQYSEMDCIALIRAVIKRTAGGVSDYRCEGTNWLWRSIKNSGKYRHLIWRQEGIEGARGGMLAFKRSGDDIHHVGLVTEKRTVIHSSSVHGCVVETELDGSWDLLGTHRYIEVAEDAAESEGTPVTAYKMQVQLSDETSSVNVRKGPSTKNDIIGRLGHGAIVTVQAEADGWAYVTYGDSGVGYVSTDYLTLYNEPQETAPTQITIIDSAGNRFTPEGDFRVIVGSLD